MVQAHVIAKVSSLNGEAFARGGSGVLRRLKVGDAIREGETVLASEGSQVALKLADGRDMVVRQGEMVKLDAEVAAQVKPDAADSAIAGSKDGFQKIVQALKAGAPLDDALEAPAAGNVAAGENEGHTFVQLMRILEAVDAIHNYRFDGAGDRNGAGGHGNGMDPILAAGTTSFLPSESAIVVVAPDNTNQNTPTITGQTVLAPGGSIILTITDSSGAVQVLTATVKADGSFSAEVPKPLADGVYTVTAVGSDAAGNTGKGSDVGSVDTVPPELTAVLDPTSDSGTKGDGLTNDTTPTLSGTGEAGARIEVAMPGTGEVLSTVVKADGTWSVTPTQAIPDGTSGQAVVTETDSAGNTSKTLVYLIIDTTPPAVAVNLDPNVAGDGMVNLAESKSAIAVTGTVSGAFNVGDPVVVTVNGKDFSASVRAGGAFSVDVPGADLVADAEHVIEARVTSRDAAGNSTTALDTQTYTVDTEPPAVAISLDANVAGDGIVNKNESTAAAIPVTGTVSGAFNVGDPVIVTVNGKEFATAVRAGGTFSVDVPGADLAADADHIIEARVTTVDAAGNATTAQDTQNYTVNTTPPAIAVSLDANVAGDGIVNLVESTSAAIPVTGTVSGAFNVGDPVIVTVNGKDFTASVRAGGTFSVDVPGTDLAADPDRIIDARVTTVDAAGNTATARDTQNYTVNTAPPAIAVSLDANVAGDGIVNRNESTAAAIPVTGTVSGTFNVGDPVTVTINGKAFTTTVRAGGTFSVDVPGADLAADADRTIDARVTTVDAAGNTAAATDTQTYTVNTNPPAIAISLDANVAGDGIVNLAESTAAAIPVTGTVSGAFNVGDPVTVTVNGKNFTTTVQTGGKFSVDVPGAELAADAERTIDARVTTVDAAGNTAAATDTQDYRLATDPPKASIALDANFAGDGIINLAESTAPAIAVTGTVGGDVKLGDPIVVAVNGKDYHTTVVERTPGHLGFSVDVPGSELKADPDSTIEARVTTVDSAGNQVSNNTSLTYTVDTTPPQPTIALDANFAGDGIINLAESTAAAIAVTGTAGGDAKLGDPVVVTVNGKDYQTTVIERGPGKLGFGVNVAGGELLADADHTIDARVTATDKAGNQATVDTSLTYTVDTTPPQPTIALDANFAGDGIINLAESTAAAIAVTGTVGGDAKLGDPVVVTINGKDYQTTVIERAPGKLGFSVDVPGGELLADGDHTIEARVTATDGAGNAATGVTRLSYTVDTVPPIVTIAQPLAGDNLINAVEHRQALVINGTATGAEDGQKVDVVLNGTHYSATVGNGVWSVTVPAADVAKLADGNYTITADVSDRAGNPAAQATLGLGVDTAAPGTPTVDIREDANHDHVISRAELYGDVDVRVTLPADAQAGDTLTVSDGTTTRSFVLGAADIGAGHIDTSFAAPPAGKTITVTSYIADAAGNVSAEDSKYATVQDSEVNVAPIAGAQHTGNLLGLLGLSALDLIDISTHPVFSAYDANNNLSKVTITYASLINLGPYELEGSMALARELGLTVTIENSPGLLGILAPSSTMTITAADGGTIDNLAMSEFLASVHYQQEILNVDVLNASTVTATDAEGLSSSSSVGTLADATVLSTPTISDSIREGCDNADALVGTAGSDRLYGFAGDDKLSGGDGFDLIRGCAGNDTIDGGNGSDLLLGGAGNDFLTGGASVDVFRWELADRGSAANPAIDRIADFNPASLSAGGDVLDLRDLLQGEIHNGDDAGNLGCFLHFERSGNDTVIQVSPDGEPGHVTQQVVLAGVDLTHNGALTSDTQIIQSLLQNGKLMTD